MKLWFLRSSQARWKGAEIWLMKQKDLQRNQKGQYTFLPFALGLFFRTNSALNRVSVSPVTSFTAAKTATPALGHTNYSLNALCSPALQMGAFEKQNNSSSLPGCSKIHSAPSTSVCSIKEPPTTKWLYIICIALLPQTLYSQISDSKRSFSA